MARVLTSSYAHLLGEVLDLLGHEIVEQSIDGEVAAERVLQSRAGLLRTRTQLPSAL